MRNVASAGLRSLQDGGKSSKGIPCRPESLRVRERIGGDLKKNFTSVAEVLCHDLEQRSGVDWLAVCLPDCHGQSCLRDGTDKDCCRAGMKADLSGD